MKSEKSITIQRNRPPITYLTAERYLFQHFWKKQQNDICFTSQLWKRIFGAVLWINVLLYNFLPNIKQHQAFLNFGNKEDLNPILEPPTYHETVFPSSARNDPTFRRLSSLSMSLRALVGIPRYQIIYCYVNKYCTYISKACLAPSLRRQSPILYPDFLMPLGTTIWAIGTRNFQKGVKLEKIAFPKALA